MEIECKECNGNGVVSVFGGCTQPPSNCCGGCEVDAFCEECKGSGILEIDPYDYVEEHREDLHEDILELKDKLVEFFSKEIVEEYLIEVSKNL